MDQAFGETAVAQIKAGWGERLPRGQRVTRRSSRKFAWVDDWKRHPGIQEVVSMEMSVPNVALIP